MTAPRGFWDWLYPLCPPVPPTALSLPGPQVGHGEIPAQGSEEWAAFKAYKAFCLLIHKLY